MIPSDPHPSLTIKLLGAFDVQVNGRPLPRLRSKKGQWLLALLALRHGHEVSREWLAETLWPESLPEDAFRSLRQSLADLRKALGDQAGCLKAPTPRTLRLDLAEAEVDAIAFDASIRCQDTAGLERAVSLYRGALLEGCSEIWVLPERESRQQAYRKALETLASQATAAGDAATSVGYLRQAVTIEPLWETARRALMAALAKSGDIHAALQVYRELIRLLRRHDPRAVPDAETSTLYQQLFTEAHRQASVQAHLPPAPLAASPPPFSIPHPVTPLIGRQEERIQVAAAFRSARLVTLTGSGGVGKTRLAIAVAEMLLENYPDGVWFVDLAPLTDAKLIARTVASVLAVREEPGIPLLHSLRRYLRDTRLLLIMDNCEHLLDACALLAEDLLRGSAGLHILATSRQALGLAGETAWRVPSLSTPDSDPASLRQLAMAYEAVQLFVQRSQAARKGFALTSENAAAIVRVCHELDGIPLALELAAARVRTLSVEQIEARLHDRFDFLKGGSRTALPRQQTLRALVDWSYDLLTESERTLLGQLSVFVGGWTLEAAEEICDCRLSIGDFGERSTRPAGLPSPSEIQRTEVLDLLTALADKSLLIYRDLDGRERYSLLETVRRYAADRLMETGTRDRFRARHRDYYLAFAEAAQPKLYGPEQASTLDLLALEHDNLRAALDFSRDDPEGAEAGLRLSTALQRYWLLRGHLGEGRERYRTALTRPGAEAPTAARANALIRAGNLAQYQGDYAEAKTLHEESLALFRLLGDRAGLGLALVNLGIVAQYQQDPVQARAFLEESLAIRRELDDREGIANTLGNLGTVEQHRANYAEARALHEESLAIRRELDDKEGIAIALVNLGVVALRQGDALLAQRHLTECLSLCRSLAETYVTPYALEGFAALAAAQSRSQRAVILYAAAAALRASTGAPLSPAAREVADRNLTTLRAALGDTIYNATWETGRAKSLEQAVAYALDAGDNE